MEALQIKETLHEYIDMADDKKLKATYIILKDSIAGKNEFSEDELAHIYDRRNKYIMGEEQSLTA